MLPSGGKGYKGWSCFQLARDNDRLVLGGQLELAEGGRGEDEGAAGQQGQLASGLGEGGGVEGEAIGLHC